MKNIPITKIQNGTDFKQRLLTAIFYGAVGFVGYKFVLKPFVNNLKQKKEQNEILDNPNKQQATTLYNAMNSSGISWLKWADGTDEEAIIKSAQKITNWDEVQKTYQNLYNRNLLQDLQSELDINDINTFLSIVGNNKTSSNYTKANTSSNIIEKGYIVVSELDIRIRSTPDSTPSTFSLNNNILGTIPKNNLIGFATGITKVDTKGVKYIQTQIKFTSTIPTVFDEVAKNQKSNILSFWVGNGGVKTFKYFKQMQSYFPSLKIHTGTNDLGLRKNIK